MVEFYPIPGNNLVYKPKTISDLSELSNNKAYTATLPNHSKGANGWAVNDTNLKSLNDLSLSQNNSDANQQFAFLTPDNGTTYYLYSVGKKKYIDNTGALTDEPTHPIVFEVGNRTGTFVVWYDADHFVNVNNEQQIIVNNWGPGGTNPAGCADDGNSIVITAVEDFNPEDALSFFGGGSDNVETDRSEELAPNFGEVDIQGIKVCADNGSFSVTTDDQYYQVWESNAKEEYWAGKVNDEVIYNTPSLVSIKSIKDATKDLSYRFHYDGSDPHRVFHTLTNVGTGMLIEAAEGYNIVGYCFDYTATDEIKDFTSYEGEITSKAGTHHVEVTGLDTRSTEILFGSGNGDIVISNFYVFIRKGMLLTEANYSKWSNMVYIPYAFTLAPYNKPDLQLYAPENSEYLDACGSECKKYSDVKVSGTDLRQQFVFIPFENYQITYPAYNGMYFVYNLGEKKFVSAQDGKAILTEYPLQAVEIEMCQEEFKNGFRINFNKTNLLNVSTEDCSQEPTSSCVNTSNNEHDGGNHFYLRAVRIFDYEPGGDVMNQIFLESNRLDDQTIIDEKGAEVKAILDKDGPGYPTDDLRSILLQHYDNITKFKEATALFQLGQFLPTYKSTTSVKMPETGKAYRIKTHYKGSLGRYLKAAENGKLTIVNNGQQEKDNTTVFVVKSMDTAKDGEGTYAIVGENGQFLVGARTGTQGFVSSYNGGTNTGSLQLTTAANKGDYFGGFLLKTTDGTNTYNLQLGTTTNNTEMVITYDAENPGSIINDPNGGSSIFYLEEVNDYPNVVKLREPAVADGKAYSSIWLPFSVEIPEGVRAYKAHVDYTTNQLVCGEVKDILPGNEGAILISDKEQEIVLAPATADVAPLEKNDLQGTNVTLARNTDVTTFVLNGGKGEIGFYPYTGTNIAKYKAYVEVDKIQAAQGLRFSFGTATDIENTLTEGEGEAKEYYDLSGRRVAQPTKGLYIVNGKKMYIK